MQLHVIVAAAVVVVVVAVVVVVVVYSFTAPLLSIVSFIAIRCTRDVMVCTWLVSLWPPTMRWMDTGTVPLLQSVMRNSWR